MIGIIYKVTNDLNDKVYVGQTIYILENRWEWHVKKASDPKDNCKFHKALRELGTEHFKIEEITRVDVKELDDTEIYYINKYDSFFNGYNSTLGGGGKRSYIYTDINIVNDILKLYQRGVSSNKIGAKYKVDKATILRVLRLYKVEIKDRSFNLDEKETETLIKLYKNGHTLSKLSRVYKVAGSTIKRFLEQHNVVVTSRVLVLRDKEKCHEIAEDYKNHNVNMQYTMRKYGISFRTLKAILKLFNVPVKNTNIKLKTV